MSHRIQRVGAGPRGRHAVSRTELSRTHTPPAIGMTLARVLVAGLVAILYTSAARAAPGAPGDTSYFDLARKDCLGTAHNMNSKVWYTVANGVLSDVYSPTIDNTNLKSLQFIVTDGRTFTDLQSRDMTYTASVTDRSGMACRVTYTAKSGRYRLVTTYVTDPARDSVVMHTRFKPSNSGDAEFTNYKLYVRYDATMNGNGGGGDANGGGDSATSVANALVASDTTSQSEAVNRDYAVPLFGALRADRPFVATESGFVGTASDGLTQLDTDRQLTARYASADDGNVVQTARIDVPANGQFTLALGYGQTGHAAVQTAGASLNQPFSKIYADYLATWRDYDRTLKRPPSRLPGLGFVPGRRLAHAYWLSANVLKASEDKTYPGAIVASLASPWGQAVSAGAVNNGQPVYFGSYREVFSRDLYEAFTGFLAVGDLKTARATVRFLFDRQQLSDGRMPRNSLVNGLKAPDTGGDQLDETAYPILMALQAGLDDDRALYRDHIKPAADFLVSHGPAFGLERWEEQGGYSPSTIAAEISGLVAAAQIADRQNDAAAARVYRATADYFQRMIKQWTVTSNGPYSNGRYFIRLSRDGDPDADTAYNLGNGSQTYDQRAIVDAGFLELSRLGILPPSDADLRRSIDVVDQVLRIDTDSGPDFYRYGTSDPGSEDGYGDCWAPDATDCSPTGSPWPPSNNGSGHLWPALAGERAEYELQTGNRDQAARLLLTMLRLSSGVGLVPEQAWENDALDESPFGADPTVASIGFRNGHPAGSASPLTWSQAQFVRLISAVAEGRPVETPSAVADRYLNGAPGQTDVAITTPGAQALVDRTTTEITGTSAPNARLTVQSTSLETGQTESVSVSASDSGTFSATLPTPFGTDVITVGAEDRSATGYAQTTLVSAAIAGSTIADLTDPEGDDNGPGAYAYPTASDFYPGAFDLTGLTVIDAGDRIAFRFQIGKLQSTFGNVIGAQLLDLYIRDPAASAFSTDPAYPGRNYRIAPGSAWSQRIEIQGFASPVYQDAQGNAVPGQVTVSPSEIANTITVFVPKSSLGGTPDSDWKIAVTLTGQDGTRADQARAFASTPQDYRFGVCAAANQPDPLCALSPSAAPQVIDALTPSGISQSAELNPLQNPAGIATVSGVSLGGD